MPSTAGWPGAPARSRSSGRGSTARSTPSSSSCSAWPPRRRSAGGCWPPVLVRYVFAVAGWLLPWLRAPLEFRYWRKVVTAAVGVALTVVVADLLPPASTTAGRAGRAWPCSPSRSVATCGGSGATGRASLRADRAAGGTGRRGVTRRATGARRCPGVVRPGRPGAARPAHPRRLPAPTGGGPRPGRRSPWSCRLRSARAVTIVVGTGPRRRHPAQGARPRDLHACSTARSTW